MRPAAMAFALGGIVLAGLLSGCETTAEKSARLERVAHHNRPVERGLTITSQSTDVRVLDAVLVRGGEGAAAVVTLRNNSGHTLRNVPIAITVKDAHGGTLFQNNAAGLEAALTSLPSLPAHGEATWINDQVQASGTPTGITATVGVAPTTSGSAPRIEVQNVRSSEESGAAGAAGTVRNRSGVAQQNLIVYVLARRSGRIVAAGRAVLPEVAAGASLPFQAFFVGSPGGAHLQAYAPASTFG